MLLQLLMLMLIILLKLSQRPDKINMMVSTVSISALRLNNSQQMFHNNNTVSHITGSSG